MRHEHSPPKVEATSPPRYPPTVRTRCLLAFLLLFLAAASCGPPRAALTVANGPDLDTLDPQLARSSAAQRASRALFAGLTRLDTTDLSLLPDLAQSWTAEDDGRLWRFHLRENLRWSDGQALTAHDVVASWERLQDPATAAPYASWVAAARFAAPSGTEVQIRFPEPQPLFPLLCSHPALAPVPAALRDAPLGSLPDPLPSSGPFQLLERRLRDRLRLLRNPQYWRSEEVQSESLDLLTIDSDITALNLFLTEGVAFAPKTPDLALPRLLEQQDARLHQSAELGTVFLRFQQRDSPFADLDLRRALLWGTDRDALATLVGHGRPAANGFVPSSMPTSSSPAWPQTNLRQAREALVRVRQRHQGALPRIELLYPSTAGNRLLVEALAALWKQDLGLEVRLMNVEARTFYPAQSALEYQVSLSSWVADYPHALSFLDIFRSHDANNRSGFADAEYDELLSLAARTLDDQVRQQAMQQAEEILRDQAVLLPLLEQRRQELVSPRLSGWQDNPLGIIDWAALEWREEP